MPLTHEQLRAVEQRRSGKVSDHLLHRIKPGLDGKMFGAFDLEHVTPYYEDRVLIRREQPEPASSVLAVPHSDRDKVGNQIGVVIGVGPGNTRKDGTREPMTVQPGDRVVYARVPPQEFEQDGELYCFVFEEQHVLAILGEAN